MQIRLHKQWAYMLILALTLVAEGWSQTRGSFRGKIVDSKGQGVAGAEVRFRDGASLAYRTQTQTDGNFVIEEVVPGTYSVEIEANGRSQTSGRTIVLKSADTTSVDLVFEEVQMTSSGASGPTEVKADAPTIQADSAEISRAYTTRTVRSLPLIDRQSQELISLMPGISPPLLTEDRVQDPQRTRILNVNGLPDYANSYFQDGSYNKEGYSGRQVRIAPNSSIQQLDVRTSNYNAEFGLAAGAHVNTVTRPGTNGLHGSAFGLHTNRFLSTRNPVNFSTSDPGFNVNQFGGSAGGPIVRDKTFWFLGYEGYLRRGDAFQIDTVPSAALQSGNFSQVPGVVIFNPNSGNANGVGRSPFAGNQVPASSISPISTLILGRLPTANQPGLFNNLTGTGLFREDQHRMDGKIDHRFSERSTGFFRYGFTHGSVDRGSQLGVLGNSANAAMRNHSAAASLTQSFTTNLAMDVRLGYSRYRNQISPLQSDLAFNNSLSALGFTNGLPEINIAGYGSFGVPGGYYSKPVNNTYDGAVNFNWHNGMHHFKFGAQSVHIRADGFAGGAFNPAGSFIFGSGSAASASTNTGFNPAISSFAGFLTGTPSVAGVSSFTERPTYRQTLNSGYATDTINLWKNVHLELGVRYDVYTPLTTRFATGSLAFDPITNQVRRSDGGGDYDWNNFAPRVGIVVRPIERMAIRAGYSLLYFPTPFGLSALNQATLGSQVGINGGFASVPFRVPTNVGTAENLNPNQPLSSTSADAQTPYVQSYNFMVQGDLGNGFLLDIGYVGNQGRQLPFERSLNASLPGSGVSGLPFTGINRNSSLNYRSTGANSNYNSLQVNLTKRFGAGLSLAGAYTYGKALDRGFRFQDPFNSNNNYAVSDYDRKHILALSHLWQLPFGPGSMFFTDGWAANLLGSWQLNGIVRWATGTPYNIGADGLACNCPGANFVPVTANQNISINGQTSFDPTTFSTINGGFGSLGRNSVRGPDYFTYDASVFRSFPVRENFNLELRAEAYNVTNNTNYVNPNGSLNSLSAGTSTRTVNGAYGRLFQLGVRLLF